MSEEEKTACNARTPSSRIRAKDKKKFKLIMLCTNLFNVIIDEILNILRQLFHVKLKLDKAT